MFGRHGQTTANELGLLAGSQTDTELTPLGEAQAHALARTVKNLNVDLIVSSPMRRTRKTAEIVARDIGYAGDIAFEPMLIERDFGSATNLPKKEAFALLDNGAATGVETVEAFGERARRALAWLRERPEQHILVVSHAAFGQMLGTLANGGKPENFLSFNNLMNAELFEFVLQ